MILMEFTKLNDRILNYAKATEKRLSKLLYSEASNKYYPSLLSSMKYTTEGGGKRIRAYLTLEFAKAAGSFNENAALDFAAAIEMIHSFSLIHDDLPAMDDDDMRRGKPTNHKVYGEATAVLAGDALSLEALRVCLAADAPDSDKVLAGLELCRLAGMEGMIGGQQIDIDGEEKSLSLDMLEKMNVLKTGALIAASCVLGCIAGGASAEQRRAAEEYGVLVGRAFQVVDDILDIEGDETMLGKAVGSDYKNCKSTYPKLLGMDESKKLAEKLSNEAALKLSAFSDGDAKNALETLPILLLNRKK